MTVLSGRNACLAVVLTAASTLGLAGVATAEEGRYALTGLTAGAYRLTSAVATSTWRPLRPLWT